MVAALAAAEAMAGQLVLGVEGLGAALAQVVALVVVHAAAVAPQQLGPVEGLGAARAGVAPRARVRQLVLAHVRGAGEALAAEAALRGLHLGVRGVVRLQVRLLHEVPAADVAAKLLDSWTDRSIYLFIYLLKAYSPVSRTGSPQGFSQDQILHKLNTIQNMHSIQM